jgi:hypothetical protein
MQPVVMFFRRTWLPTTLCVLVATAIYWRLFSWESARESIIPTAILAPAIWWCFAGRLSHPTLGRAFLAGAIVGPVTQALPVLLPEFLRAYSPHGLGSGEQQAVAMVTVSVYLTIGLFSVPIGGLVGLIAVLIQRRAGHSP